MSTGWRSSLSAWTWLAQGVPTRVVGLNAGVWSNGTPRGVIEVMRPWDAGRGRLRAARAINAVTRPATNYTTAIPSRPINHGPRIGVPSPCPGDSSFATLHYGHP